jgi:drug/metabolite transporter (DMT)-like permease
MLGMQVVGTILYAIALAAAGRFPTLSVEQLPLAVALAALGLAGLLCFYKALALGPIAIVSPIGGAYVAVAVLLVVAFLGERLSSGQTVGVLITVAGIVMTSTDARSVAAALSRPKPGVWLALAAMLLFGGWAALMAYATRTNDGLAMILLQRILSVAASLAILLLLRRDLPRRVGLATAGVVIASGLFDTLANVLYVLGVQAGFASIVATGSGVYPIIPALLGITVMGERLAPNQYVGIAVLLGGLVTLGLVGS